VLLETLTGVGQPEESHSVIAGKGLETGQGSGISLIYVEMTVGLLKTRAVISSPPGIHHVKGNPSCQVQWETMVPKHMSI